MSRTSIPPGVSAWHDLAQEKGEDAFDKRLAIAQQLKVGDFILEINCEGAVFSRWFGARACESLLYSLGFVSEGSGLHHVMRWNVKFSGEFSL